jgi:hypothetical protein
MLIKVFYLEKQFTGSDPQIMERESSFRVMFFQFCKEHHMLFSNVTPAQTVNFHQEIVTYEVLLLNKETARAAPDFAH